MVYINCQFQSSNIQWQKALCISRIWNFVNDYRTIGNIVSFIWCEFVIEPCTRYTMQTCGIYNLNHLRCIQYPELPNRFVKILQQFCYFRFVNLQADAIKSTDPSALVSVGVWNPMCNTDAFGLNDLYKDSCLTSAGGKSGVSSYDSSIMSLYEINFIKLVCKLRLCSVIRETFMPSGMLQNI